MADNIERGDHQLNEIGSDLQEFEKLSTIDRERAYIAFLTYTRLEEAGRRIPGTELKPYAVASGEISIL